MRPIAAGLGYFIAVLFLISGFSKFLDPGAFAKQINLFDLYPWNAKPLAFYIIWLEIVLGLGLLVKPFKRPAMGLSIYLLIFFTGVLSITLIRGIDLNCGCFGAGKEQNISWLDIARNVALILMGIVSFKYSSKPLKSSR